MAGGLNTYAYVKNNPVSFTDPNGLMTFELEAYRGVGGGISISYDSGTLEILGRIGVGYGGGFSWDPSGKPSPHSKKCGSGLIARESKKIDAGAHLGPFGGETAFMIASGNAFTDKFGGGFTDYDPFAFTVDDHDMRIGAGMGISFGVDIGSYANW